MAKILVTVTDNEGGISREDYTRKDIDKMLEPRNYDLRDWEIELIEAYKKPIGAEVGFNHIPNTIGFIINDSL